MIRRNIRFFIQKRVGYAMGFVTVAISVNTIIYHLSDGMNIADAMASPAVWPIILYAIVSFFTTMRESSIAQMAQVLTFAIAGILTIVFSESGNLAEVNLLSYAILLCIQYGFLNKHFILKLVIMGIMFTGLKLGIEAIKENPLPTEYHLSTIIYFFIYLYLVWVIFVEEINDYKAQTKELRQEIDKNEIFVSFGKNVTSVIHNLKNKLMSINTFNELIASSDDPEIQKYSSHQREVIDETNTLLADLNFAVKSKQKVKPEEIALGKIIRSVVALFNANLRFHKEVQVHFDLTEDDYILLSPLEATQLLENVIRNAWEAIKDKGSGENIFITTEKIGKELKLTIKDEGIGIPFCQPCKHANCIDCREFRIGRTTKETGTGVGMVFVQNLLHSIGGRLKINSVPGEGTEIEIYFISIKRNNNDYLVD